MTPGAAVSKGRTMATSPMADLVRQLRRSVVLRDGAGSTDGELLEAFVSRHDGAATTNVDLAPMPIRPPPDDDD